MKHSLQLKLSQHLTLTPQLQQSIRLLQLSTLELNQELETYLQQNPFLERLEAHPEEPAEAVPADAAREAAPEGEAPSPAEPAWDDDVSFSPGRDEHDEQDYPQLAADSFSLRQHLTWQLSLTQLSGRDKSLVSLLIDTLDEDGYLTQNLDELAESLPAELAVEPIELSTALKHLQNFDPPGVGARTLAECLALQLEALPATPCRNQALLIAKNHLELLAARDYARLKKLLQCDDAELRAAQRLITGLNPRPGAKFSQTDTHYVIPDVIVRKTRGKWTAALNPEAMPRLRVNRMYADILQRHRGSGSQQLAGQLQEARWLIKNVQQRFDTILRVSQAIVERQQHFFEHGEVAMRPLVLREIAEAVGLHESTVSRVTTQKYLFTPRGSYELKHFFGSHVATETGGACSATAIRALIKQLIGAENSRKPLSDSQLAEILSRQGIVVARRTVAKYRESLQIPAVSLRKSI